MFINVLSNTGQWTRSKNPVIPSRHVRFLRSLLGVTLHSKARNIASERKYVLSWSRKDRIGERQCTYTPAGKGDIPNARLGLGERLV
jgi:hypothetical protein